MILLLPVNNNDRELKEKKKQLENKIQSNKSFGVSPFPYLFNILPTFEYKNKNYVK